MMGVVSLRLDSLSVDVLLMGIIIMVPSLLKLWEKRILIILHLPQEMVTGQLQEAMVQKEIVLMGINQIIMRVKDHIT